MAAKMSVVGDWEDVSVETLTGERRELVNSSAF